MKEFSALYLNYFKEKCYISDLDPQVSESVLQNGAKTFVRQMKRKIKEGSRIAFVDDNGTEFDGFIVGGIFEIECGSISHMYIEGTDDVNKRKTLLSLYRALALELKRHGAKKIVVGGEQKDEILMSQIKELDLKELESYGSYVEYGKKL